MFFEEGKNTDGTAPVAPDGARVSLSDTDKPAKVSLEKKPVSKEEEQAKKDDAEAVAFLTNPDQINALVDAKFPEEPEEAARLKNVLNMLGKTMQQKKEDVDVEGLKAAFKGTPFTPPERADYLDRALTKAGFSSEETADIVDPYIDEAKAEFKEAEDPDAPAEEPADAPTGEPVDPAVLAAEEKAAADLAAESKGEATDVMQELTKTEASGEVPTPELKERVRRLWDMIGKVGDAYKTNRYNSQTIAKGLGSTLWFLFVAYIIANVQFAGLVGKGSKS